LLSKASFIALEFQMHCQYPELSKDVPRKKQLTETQYEIRNSSSIRRRYLRTPQDHRARGRAEGDISYAGEHDEENTPQLHFETSRGREASGMGPITWQAVGEPSRILEARRSTSTDPRKGINFHQLPLPRVPSLAIFFGKTC